MKKSWFLYTILPSGLPVMILEAGLVMYVAGYGSACRSKYNRAYNLLYMIQPSSVN